MKRTKVRPPSIPPEMFPSFSPAVLCMLRDLIEEAWAELKKSNGAPISPEYEQLTRELLAHRLMSRAARGELDPQRLREHAVAGMSRRRRRQSQAA